MPNNANVERERREERELEKKEKMFVFLKVIVGLIISVILCV